MSGTGHREAAVDLKKERKASVRTQVDSGEGDFRQEALKSDGYADSRERGYLCFRTDRWTGVVSGNFDTQSIRLP